MIARRAGGEIRNIDAGSVDEGELERFLDGYKRSADLTPEFEEFFGKIWRGIKKVSGKAVSLAKRGISFVGQTLLGPLFKKLKALIQPLPRRVVRFAISRLPVALQPVARTLAAKLGLHQQDFIPAILPNGRTGKCCLIDGWTAGVLSAPLRCNLLPCGSLRRGG